MVTIWCLANSTQAEDITKVHCLFKAGGKAMVHLASMATVNWMNCILNWQDATLSEFTKYITLQDKRGLHNSPVFNKSELLPSWLLCWINNRTRQSLQDLAFRQACSANRPRPSTSRLRKIRPTPGAFGA